jgi:hypothetical protein
MDDFQAISHRPRAGKQRIDLRLVADEDDAHLGIFLYCLDRPLHDRPGRVIAPHRIERETHGLALLGFLDDDSFTPLSVMPAAIPADCVRLVRFAAADAVRILLGLQMLMTPPLALARGGDAPFRNSHGDYPFTSRVRRGVPFERHAAVVITYG